MVITLKVNGSPGAVDQTEELIAKTAVELAVATGKCFFQALVNHLILELRADYAAIGKLLPDSPCRGIALACAPELDASEFALAGTPEGQLVHAGPFLHCEDAGRDFPADARLVKMGAEHWSGALLTSSSGEPLGFLSAVFRRRPGDLGAIEATLSRYATRAAAEMERERTEEALRLSESRYQELIKYSSEGVWCLEFDPPLLVDLPEDELVSKMWEARFAVANDAVARMLGFDSGAQVVGRFLNEFDNLLPYTESHFRETIRRGIGPRTLEFAVCRDGAESWWERSVLPIVVSGKLVRIWGTTRDISERKRHEKEVQGLNASLERMVADRTTQLAAANQELEAFSYSVSHDLRAAIQGILACSRIVVQDHGHQLDETGRVWLNHMADDAAQLDKLTMALLDLSFVSRAGLCRNPIDLSCMAESIGQRLTASDRGRQANFRVAPGLTVSADPALLRGVMDNLLGNAWKFTRTREAAEIEVGVTTQSSEPVYFVRDNGVGFNMKYADKLFGAFQRLHRMEDFDGNGIGLATVRRVIHRHGGRVWAEAEVNRGATFFFTLGKSDSP